LILKGKSPQKYFCGFASYRHHSVDCSTSNRPAPCSITVCKVPSARSIKAEFLDRHVHTPETDGEYDIDNVRKEGPALGIKYPVVTDNDYKTWKAYGVEAWPTIVVLDKQGRIRWLHVGEGHYEETESVINKLLGE